MSRTGRMGRLFRTAFGAAEAATHYLRDRPDVVLRMGLNAARMRFGVPLAAFNWIFAEFSDRSKPTRVELTAAPPGVALRAELSAMGSHMRATGEIHVASVKFAGDAFLIELQLRDLALEILDDSETPLATLVRSGALDLSRPGNLLKYIPKRPPVIAEASGDRVTLDLFKLPQFEKNPRLRSLLARLDALVNVKGIDTDGDALYIEFGALPPRVAQLVGSLARGGAA